LSPSFPRVRVMDRHGGIRTGGRVELRIGPFRWVALHTLYVKNRRFVDEQVEGPFRSWIHSHEVEDLGGRTRLTDRVEFRLPGGPFVDAIFGGLIKVGLLGMFRARHAATRRFCEEKARAG